MKSTLTEMFPTTEKSGNFSVSRSVCDSPFQSADEEALGAKQDKSSDHYPCLNIQHDPTEDDAVAHLHWWPQTESDVHV